MILELEMILDYNCRVLQFDEMLTHIWDHNEFFIKNAGNS